MREFCGTNLTISTLTCNLLLRHNQLSINLPEKVMESQRACEFARHSGIELHQDQLPTIGMYRRVALNVALRCSSDDGKVRGFW